MAEARQNQASVWPLEGFRLRETCATPRRDNFQLSRPVRKGETIDFFVSHSWSDNPARKWRALQVVADEFFRRLALTYCTSM